MNGLHLLPPRKGLCQICAFDHAPTDPHNAQSLYYVVQFQMKHGRSPTWGDAMAHCSSPIREAWTRELTLRGGMNWPAEGEPIAQPATHVRPGSLTS